MDIYLSKLKIKAGFLILPVFLFFALAASSQTKTTIYEEDFENVAPVTEFNSTTNEINGLSGWSYLTQGSNGRLRFDVVSHSGNKAALMDPGYTENYLLYEADLRGYSQIELFFWHNDYGDERHNLDKLWIRGSENDPWIMVMDLDGRTNHAWKQENINVSQILSNHGQTVSSTFQIRFGQYDTNPYSVDGRAFDDIKLTGLALTIEEILVDAVKDCGSKSDYVEVKVANYTREAKDINLQTRVTFPDASTKMLYNTVEDVGAGEHKTVQVGPFNTTMGGSYTVEASIIDGGSRSATFESKNPIENIMVSDKLCGVADDNLKVGVRNYYSQTKDIYLNTEVKAPDGTTTSIEDTVDNVYPGNSEQVTVGSFNTLEKGLYEVKVTKEGCSDPVVSFFEVQNPLSVPYSETFEQSSESRHWWKLSPDFTMNNGNISGSDVQDGAYIVSPSLNIADSSYYLSYGNPLQPAAGNLDANDTVFVQIGNECSGSYTTIDTLSQGDGFAYMNGYLMDDYAGNDVNVRFSIRSTDNSGLDFTLYNMMAKSPLKVEDIFMHELCGLSCGQVDQPVHVVISNQGTSGGLTDIPVKLEVYGPNKQTLDQTYTETLNVGERDTVQFLVDNSAFGSYEITATATHPDFAGTKSKVTENFDVKQPEHQYLSESLYDGTDWCTNSNMVWNSGRLISNWLNLSDQAVALSPKIGPVVDGSQLSFSYRITSDMTGDTIDSGDSVLVQVSTDCANSFETLHTIDSLNNESFGDYVNAPELDMSAYAGQNVFVRFVAFNGENPAAGNQFKVELDEVAVSTPDIAPYQLSHTIDTICGSENASATVRFKNQGMITAEDIPVALEITASDFEDVIYRDTISSLKPDAVYEKTFNNITAMVPQTYHFSLYSEYDKDMDRSNDTLNKEVTVMPVQSLPYANNFNDYDDVQNWQLDRFYRDYNIGEILLRTHYLNQSDSAMAITPKMGIVDQNTYLKFDFAAEAWDGEMIGYYLRENDQVDVLVSGNCGDSWNVVKTINRSSYSGTSMDSPELQPYVVDLSGYEGSNIQVAFKAKKENSAGEMRIDLDDVYVLNGDSVSVTNILTDKLNPLCGDETAMVDVVVENYGRSVSDVPVTLEANSNVIESQSFEQTVSMDAGERDTLTFSTVDTRVPGTYMFEGYTPDSVKSGVMHNTLEVMQIPYTAHVPTQTVYSGADTVALNNLVGPIPAGAVMKMDYLVKALDNQGNQLGNYLREGDSIQVMLSGDCGNSYEKVYSITKANYEASSDSSSVIIDLSDYEGEELHAKLRLVKGEIGGYTFGGTVEFSLPEPDFEIITGNTVEKPGNHNRYICGLEADSLYLTIGNPGTEALESLDLNLEISYAEFGGSATPIDTIQESWTGELLPDSTMKIGMGAFNTVRPGEYSIDLTMNGADKEETVSGPILEVDTVREIPYTRYAGNAYNSFVEDPRSQDNWFGESYIYHYNYLSSPVSEGDTSILRTPRFETVKENDYLIFRHAFTGTFENTDVVKLMVSTDCGKSYTAIETLDNPENIKQEPEWLEETVIDLSDHGLVGEKPIFKFEAVNASGKDYYFHVSKFGIATMDASVASISTENADDRFTTCGEANDSLFVDIRNNSIFTLESVPLTVDKNGTQESYTLNKAIDMNSTYNDYYIGTLNTTTSGTHNVAVYTELAEDNNNENDTLGFTISTQKPYEVPYSAFSGDHPEEEEYWSYDQEGNMNQYLNASLTKGETGYAVTPRLTGIDSLTYLVFRYNINNSMYDHIVQGELINVKVSSGCSDSWQLINQIDVSTNDSSSYAMDYINLKDFNGSDIRIRFEAVKGNSDGVFQVNIDDVQLVNYEPVELSYDKKWLIPGSSVELNAGSGYNHYTWYRLISGDSNIGHGQFFNVYESGTYHVMAGKQGITSRDTVTITDSLPAPDAISSSGSTVCSNESSTYSVTSMPYVDRFVWELDPADAGVIQTGRNAQAHHESINVDWNESFTGTATLKVAAKYDDEKVSDTVSTDVTVEACPVGIDELSNAQISLYPVPADEVLYCEVKDFGKENVQIAIFNALGAKVISKELDTREKSTIDVSELNDGVYMVKIISDNNSVTRRLIVE